MQIKKFDIDSRRGLIYLKQILKDGQTLSRCLLKRLKRRCSQIKVFTFLPPNIPQEEIYEFTTGYKFPVDPSKIIYKTDAAGNPVKIMEPIPFPTCVFLDYVLNYLSSDRLHSLIVFENRYADPSFVKEYKSRVIIYNKEIYHIVTGKEMNRYLIKKAMRESMVFFPPHSICILAKLNDIEIKQLENVNKIQLDNLQVLSKRTEQIIVGAYDGEGFLVYMLK